MSDGFRNSDLMPFQKFVQTHLRLIFHDEKRKINGTFKDVETGEIIKGDDFEAHLVGSNHSAEETYKAYITWFNHTLERGEHKREYVFAEWDVESENV